MDQEKRDEKLLEEESIAGEGDLIEVPESGDLSESSLPQPSLFTEEVVEEGSRELVLSDPLERYLAEIRHLPTLTREEEREIAIRYFEQGDKLAGYRLVMANLRLVVMIAREYQRNAQNILDLVQEGNIGLLEAVKQYDPYRGIRFPSYAVYWIRAYMLRYLINNLRLVKIGTTQAQRKLFFNLQKERERLEAEGFVPEAKLLAERLQVKESEVVEMEQRLALPDVSVDAPLRTGDGEDQNNLHGVLPDHSVDVEAKVAEREFREALRSVVDRFKGDLDDKERAIIDDRLMTEDPATLQVIADRFGLSRERIRQIENRLKERLKKVLQEELQLDQSGEIAVREETGESGRAVLKFLVLLLVFLSAVGGYGYYQWTKFAADKRYATYARFMERDSPRVSFPESIPGIGISPGTIAIQVEDDGAGVDEVIVRCEQDGKVQELLRKRYSEYITSDILRVRVSGKELHLNSGAARVEVSVFDKAFWSNAQKDAFQFEVDYEKPKVSILSAQHNTTVGGTELAFYVVQEKGRSVSGVQVGERQFLGRAASLLDPEFEKKPKVMAAFFALPLGFRDDEPVQLFALDPVGNIGNGSFYYRALRGKRPVRSRKLEAETAARYLAAILKQHQQSGSAELLSDTLSAQFEFVKTEVWRETDRRLQKISENSADQWLGRGPFLRQRGAITVEHGDLHRLLVGGEEVGSFVQRGVDFLVPRGTPVVAADHGIVSYVGELGVYGNAVVVDHGFGISTLYGFLGQVAATSGAKVTPGEELGVSGNTGLSFGDRVHFQVLVHGVSVRPVEWWDRRWLSDHFEKKIDEVKKTLGIRLPQIVE